MTTPRRTLAAVLLLLAAAGMLSGCGNKGDLVRPTPTTVASVPG